MFLLVSAVATTMNLVCPGVWASTTKGTDLVWNNEDSKFDNVWVDKASTSEGEVRVELQGTDGRLMMSGRKKGNWQPLSDVRREGALIQARMRFNLLDHPSVTIDPAAGRIRIHGRSDRFLGICQAGRPDDQP